MELIRHDDLRIHIGVKLTVHAKAGRERLLDEIMSTLSEAVIVKPGMVGFHCSARRGAFGVDEPHPFPDLLDNPSPPHPRLPGL